MGIDQTAVASAGAQPAMSTQEKALAINLDAGKFGTFAEIGAGQEVARWFFHVGHASATVAKSMSAYDMVISDILYGATDHYVSRARLESMLEREWNQLLERLDRLRGERTGFFVFADTVATRSRTRNQHGQGWMGIRFQTEPRAPHSQIIIHVNLLDEVPVSEQEALGILGVNLMYGAFHQQQPGELMHALMEGLSHLRVDIDMIKFSGAAYDKVDNRLACLQLVELGLTDSTMFTAQGEVVQPAEVLYKKPVLISRGRFRPITNVGIDMLNAAVEPVRENSRRGSGPGDHHGYDAARPGYRAWHQRPRLSRPRRYVGRPRQDGYGVKLPALRQCHQLFSTLQPKLDGIRDGPAHAALRV